jgi:hypothetical protein
MLEMFHCDTELYCLQFNFYIENILSGNIILNINSRHVINYLQEGNTLSLST